MSDHLDVHQVDDPVLEQRRNALLVPARIATYVVLSLIALSVLYHVVGEVVVHQHPGWVQPAGTTYLPPSDSERVRIIARALAPILAGLALLLLMWRLRRQGRRVPFGVCAVAAILMGVASVW